MVKQRQWKRSIPLKLHVQEPEKTYKEHFDNFAHSETVIFLVVLSTSFSGPIHVVLKEWIVSAVVALPYHQLAIKVEQLLSNPIGTEAKM